MASAAAAPVLARSIYARRRAIVLPLLAIAFCAVFLAATGTGALPLSAGKIAAILAKQTGFELPWAFSEREESVVLLVRLPRVVFAAFVGAGLAVSGVLLQALFRNPLADPGLIGISSGAALGAASMIVLGGTALAPWTLRFGKAALPLAAFIAAFGAMVLIQRLASQRGQTMIATMLLAGIAVNASCSALLGLLTFIADDAQLRTITFWMLGSLSGGAWSTVVLVAPLVGAAVFLVPPLGRALNALVLGEAEAAHLGIPVERIKRIVVLLTATVVAACTAFCGMVGFVGLIVPHLVRLFAGPDHRVLLPGSALLGGALLMVADLIARTAIAPAELPLGVLTAVVGSPFFFWLLLRERSRRTLA